MRPRTRRPLKSMLRAQNVRGGWQPPVLVESIIARFHVFICRATRMPRRRFSRTMSQPTVCCMFRAAFSPVRAGSANDPLIRLVMTSMGQGHVALRARRMLVRTTGGGGAIHAPAPRGFARREGLRRSSSAISTDRRHPDRSPWLLPGGLKRVRDHGRSGRRSFSLVVGEGWSTSRTRWARLWTVKGLGRNWTPSSRTPWWAMTSAV